MYFKGAGEGFSYTSMDTRVVSTRFFLKMGHVLFENASGEPGVDQEDVGFPSSIIF